MRENRMLRSTWRGLETWFGRKLINTGAPVPDPTDERGRETGCASTRSPRPSSTLPRTVFEAGERCTPSTAQQHFVVRSGLPPRHALAMTDDTTLALPAMYAQRCNVKPSVRRAEEGRVQHLRQSAFIPELGRP